MSRVLLVGKGAPDRGGIPSFLEMLRNSELRHRHDVGFLNVAHAGTPEGGAITVGNVRRTILDAVHLWRAARGQDVVHVNSAVAPSVTAIRAGLLAATARLRGCAVVVHVHGGNISTQLETTGGRLALKLALAPAHRVVAVWASGYDALLAVVGDRRLRYVPNGVDTARFRSRPRDQGPPRILYVGLLTPRKGVLDLLAASSQLAAEGVEHQLDLLGGMPDEGPAAAEPVMEAAAGRANLLGTRPPEEMPSAYASADVFCLPSWWEAMPMSVLEAMASGLPVVASAVGDVARLVEDGVTGYIVPPRSVEDLVAALRKLLLDAELRREMGTTARRVVEERFSDEASAAAVAQVYDEAMGSRR